MKVHQIKHLGLQVIRRCVQVSVVTLMFGLIFLSIYAHYRAARAIDDLREDPGFKARVLSRIDDGMVAVDKPQEFLDGFKGTLWSMRVFGVDVTDPLAVVEFVAASKTLHLPLLFSALIPIIVTLLLGRVFCSWVCPAGLLLEITGKLRKLLRFAEVPPAEVKFSPLNKYVLLVVGLLIVGLMGLPIFAQVYPPAVLSRMAHAWIFGTTLTGMLVLMGLIVAFEVLISPRWWCRSMCPGAALYGLLGWRRLLRVKIDPNRCTNCGVCEPVCEPGINPVTQSDGIECDNCGVCIRHCPEAALFYTMALTGRKPIAVESAALMVECTQQSDDTNSHQPAETPTPSAKSRRRTVIAPLVLLALLPATAKGHHILGLPHYSYKENYPQVPTLEYPATTGPYDVLLTSYPGKPIPGQPANIAIYIKNRTTGVPYDQPIAVRVLQTFTFGRNRVILPATEVQPFEIPHKLTVTFPEDGEYIVELIMEVEGTSEVIPFMMIAGEPTAAISILVVIGTGLVTFLIAVRAIKIKRARRRDADAGLAGESHTDRAGGKAKENQEWAA